MLTPDRSTTNEFLVSLVTAQDEEKIVYYDQVGRALNIDLRSIVRTLLRLGEVAIVNVSTAPELMSTLNKTHLDLGELAGVVRHHLDNAKDWLREERSRILIDEVPALLAEKKLSNSKDNRDALIELAETCQKGKETVNQLTAVLQWLLDKREGVKNAWSSVRAILGDRTGIPLSGRSPYTSGGTNGPTRFAPNTDSPWGETRLD